MSRAWIAVLVLIATLVAGCGGATAPPSSPAQGPTPSRLPEPLPPPAEPATSPPVSVPPPGPIVPVGAAPEGIVADPVTRRVAVGVREPSALVLLDADRAVVVGKVPLPGFLRHLQLAGPGGPVLVPDESSNSLVQVALPDGAIQSQVPTGVFPHDATRAGDGTLFVANEMGGTVVAVRGNDVVRTFSDVTQPAGLAAVGNTVALVDVRENTITFYDAESLTGLVELPAGRGPTHVVADKHGRMIVSDTRGDAILVYGLDPAPREVGRVEVPGQPYGITYDTDRDRLWVTITAANQVVGYDMAEPTPREVARIPTVRQPNTVAVDSATGRLFVTGTTDGVVQVITP